VRRPAIAAAGLALLGLVAPAGAAASPTVTASASFAPDRLGSPTALVYAFQIGDTSGALPPPLSRVVAMLPAGSEVDTAGLGVCPSLSALAQMGASACPSSSFAGFGSSQVAAAIGATLINETAALTIFLGPSTPGHTVLDFYADGTTPVSEQLAFTGTEEPASAPYGLSFVVNIPAIPTVPGAPDASILSLKSTIGAPNAAYYVTKRHRRVLEHVKGLVVPKRCPPGVFPFALAFSFTDGTTLTAPLKIACP